MEIDQNEENCYINLYQKNPRIIKKDGKYPNKPVLGFIILAKEDEQKNLKYIDSITSFSNSKENYQMHIALQQKLAPGIYYIFCDVIYRYKYPKNSGYTISVYSKHSLKSLTNDTDNLNGDEYLKKVVYDCCKTKHLSKTTTDKFDIYKRNLDLKFPFIAYCIYNRTNSKFKIEFKIKRDEDDINCSFYSEGNIEEAEEEVHTLIKIIEPKTLDVCLTIPYDFTSKYKLIFSKY